ncbi:AAA family ATPase [Methanothrix soehngenii]|jgi:predicted ATPase|uniref:AAA family ATPase n=1 Tax=Methanothrix soehngenii TaxID=2223 RepID=UPI00235582C7|nr:AAA family ATPase [Methanothrix soehngenii]
MIVSHMILKNWRNFQAVDVTLQERVFLVGPNASGKSNLLDAFRFLRDIAKDGGGLQKAVADRGRLPKIRCLSARRSSNVEIEIQLAESSLEPTKWKYAIGITQEKGGKRRPILVYEKVWTGDKLILERPDEQDNHDTQRLTQTHLEQINSNMPFREIAVFLTSIQYMHLVPQLLRYPDSFPGQEIPGDPFGKRFLENLAKTSDKTRSSRLNKIESALHDVVPQLKELSFIKDETGAPHLEAVYEHWRPKAGKQREDQFSDGTLRLIALLWSLQEGKSLLLLEEPELSLNAGIVSKLAPVISRLQRQTKRQVMLSTHSPDLLSDKGIGGEEVLILKPGAEGTEIKVASSMHEIKDLLEGGLSIADAVLPITNPQKALSSWGI